MSDRSALGTMPLYTHLDRIARGLAAHGIGPNDAVPPEQLFAIDRLYRSCSLGGVRLTGRRP